jgi:putative PIN family toxin of toxin-antitoxin system
VPSAVRLVIDTNVVVSAQLWGGVPRRLIELAHAGEISLFSSAPLLDELARVLAEPKFSPRFARSSTAIEDLVLGYAELVTLVTPALLPEAVSRDPDNDPVVATALAARADAIVSGDADLLSLKVYQNILILSPANAIDAIARTRAS